MKRFLKMLLSIVAGIVALFAVTLLSVSGYLYLKQDPSKLYGAISRADRIVLTRHNNDARPFFTSEDPAVIRSLSKVLKVQKKMLFRFPTCQGNVGINLYRNGRKTAAIAWLPNGDIREDMIDGVGYLPVTDRAALARWLEEHGAPAPRQAKKR